MSRNTSPSKKFLDRNELSWYAAIVRLGLRHGCHLDLLTFIGGYEATLVTLIYSSNVSERHDQRLDTAFSRGTGACRTDRISW